MIQIRIGYQPLSNNRMWQGQRFKSADYKKYELDMGRVLPRRDMILGPVEISYRFHVPNNLRRDISNFIKPLEDIIVKKGYIRDDSLIYRFTVERIAAKEWGIEFKIKSIIL